MALVLVERSDDLLRSVAAQRQTESFALLALRRGDSLQRASERPFGDKYAFVRDGRMYLFVDGEEREIKGPHLAKTSWKTANYAHGPKSGR